MSVIDALTDQQLRDQIKNAFQGSGALYDLVQAAELRGIHVSVSPVFDKAPSGNVELDGATVSVSKDL